MFLLLVVKDMNAINYKIFYWGPLLMKSSIDPEICDQILDRFSRSNIDHRDMVASQIDKVLRIEDFETRVWFSKTIEKHLECYLQLREEWFGDKKNYRFLLDKLWINYQEKGESNTEHTHCGDVSFVLYLDIPESIYKENMNFTGRSPGPGSIVFRYGEYSEWAVHLKGFLPKKGELFIFPANLAHAVPPFTSDGTRISVSGNFFYEQVD